MRIFKLCILFFMITSCKTYPRYNSRNFESDHDEKVKILVPKKTMTPVESKDVTDKQTIKNSKTIQSTEKKTDIKSLKADNEQKSKTENKVKTKSKDSLDKKNEKDTLYALKELKLRESSKMEIHVDTKNSSDSELIASQSTKHYIRLNYQVYVPKKRAAAQAILKLIEKVDPQFRTCYTEHIATTSPCFEGDIQYRFTINKLSQGFSKLTQLPNKKQYPGLERCIMLALGQLRFVNDSEYNGQLKLSFAKPNIVDGVESGDSKSASKL